MLAEFAFDINKQLSGQAVWPASQCLKGPAVWQRGALSALVKSGANGWQKKRERLSFGQPAGDFCAPNGCRELDGGRFFHAMFNDI